MAKRKDLLLTESTTMRMMGLAGIGSLANPFLKENYGEEDPMMNEMGSEYNELEEGEYGEGYMDELEEGDKEDDYVAMSDEGDEGDEGDDDKGMVAEGMCESCGGMHEGRGCPSEMMNENVAKRLKRLKRLLEQAAAEEPPPPAEEPPPAMEGGDDAMEDKIKEFVKKLGELVQETLGVQVTVEEQEEEPEGGAEAPPSPEGEAEAVPPAPMAEAINRLVNKVARRVKARLMEAKKKDPKVATKSLKEKQAAAKKKEEEVAKKKKEMMMKKKKAAALKAKKK